MTIMSTPQREVPKFCWRRLVTAHSSSIVVIPAQMARLPVRLHEAKQGEHGADSLVRG